MDKATPTLSPASVDSVMALAQHYAVALLDLDRNEGASPKRTFNAAMDALRAEVERLAAQAAPNLLDAFKSGNAILIDWPMEPVTPQEALKLMDMMDAEYTKTVGKSSPDREMAVCMQRVQHMACDLWASQKEVMRSHFVELVAAQPSQAPVVQAGEYPPLPEGKAVIRCVADTDEGGWVVDFDCEGPLSHEAEEGDELFTADQMHAYLDADRASTVAALKARAAELEDFIVGIGQDLHHERVADWYPEGANNAALAMSESMRLIGNRCVDFDAALKKGQS